MESNEMTENIRKSKETCLKINDEEKALEIGRIIREYKEQNNIEILTEEDLINIFGIEALYPDPNMPISEWFDHSICTVCDWQDYYYSDYNINTINNISISDEFDEIDLGSTDQLNKDDEFMDLIDNEYLPNWLPDDYPQVSEAKYWKECEKYIEIEMIKELYDLGDADSIDEGEWECSMEEELEYYLLLRTKTVEVNVTDVFEVMHWVSNGMEETTFCLKIHWDEGDRKFLIRVSDEEQCLFYQVILEFDYNNSTSFIYLGDTYSPGSVLSIIDSYIDGKCLFETACAMEEGINSNNDRMI